MSEMSIAQNNAVIAGMNTVSGFELMQRQAKMLSSSSMVPKEYQGQTGMPNCMIALDISHRMNIPPIMVMQNMHVIHGRPTWGAPFLISSVNGCGKFSAIRYEFNGLDGDDWGCRSVATERSTGFVLNGPWVTIGIARAEGWLGKSGSKWRTMPELMLCYRSATWWVRLYAPEVSMGMLTDDEVHDISASASPAKNNSMRDMRPMVVEAVDVIDEPEPRTKPKPNPNPNFIPNPEPEPEPEPEHEHDPVAEVRDDVITGPIKYVKYAVRCLEMAKTEADISSIMDRLETGVLHNEAVKDAAAAAIKRLITQVQDDVFPGDR